MFLKRPSHQLSLRNIGVRLTPTRTTASRILFRKGRNHINVVNVGKASVGVTILPSTGLLILGRNPLSIKSVSKVLTRMLPFLCIRKLTRATNSMYVMNMGQLLVRVQTCGIRKLTLEKNHVRVNTVTTHPVMTHSLVSIRKLTQIVSPTTVTNAARLSPGSFILFGTRRPTLGNAMNVPSARRPSA
uniref:Testis cDNA clone: QtsA-13228, similar to human zinc finger protein 473 (ZNF473) n=1 Tax=Macaca fascicularis TaxID=9541 RepID=Q4R873_MACFA|nr:unnamed protein product [Macaca fascicularis]